jgi:tetratricopeptide (TPR) repeat protein
MAGLSRRDEGFSPDGQLLVTVDDDENDIRVWDLSTDRLSRNYLRIPDIPKSWGYNLFAFSPDGRTIACCNKRGTVDLWDTASFSRGRILSYGYFGPAVAVAFAPDGNSLASAGRDLDTGRFRIDLRDLPTGAVRSVGEHVQQIISLEFTRDGQRLASADAKGSLQVWEEASGKRLLADPQDQSEFPEAMIYRSSTPHGFCPMPGDLGCSPDGTRVVLPKRPPGRETRQAIFNLGTGELERELEVGEEVVASSPDGRLLAIGGGMEIRLVDCATWQVKGVLKGHMQIVNGLAFSPDGKRLASASRDQVILWNVATQTETLILAAPASWAPSSVAFSPDGRSLAVAGGREIRIYRGAGDQEVLAGRRQPEAISELERAHACRRRKAWKEAIVHYTRAVEQSPDDDAGWWGRARCYAETGELDRALRDYQRVIELWRRLGVSFMSHCEYQGTQWDLMQDLTDLAERWEKQGQMERAIEVHRLAVQMWDEVCQKAGRMKKFASREEAGREMPRTEVMEAMQGLTEARRRLIGCLNDQARKLTFDLPPEQRKWKAAEALWRQAVELSSDGSGPHNNLGLALRATGDYAGAVGEFQKAIAYFQDKADSAPGKPQLRENVQTARTNLATTYSNWSWILATAAAPAERDPAKAVELARKALELEPDAANHLNNLGVAQYRAGHYQAAVEWLDKADATIAGGDRAHRMFLAMAHWQLGNKEQARERYAEGAAWIASHRMNSEEQNRFRAEAEQLMEITPEERNRLVEEYLARPAEKKSDVPNER